MSAQVARLGRERQQLGAVEGVPRPELGRGWRRRPGSSAAFQSASMARKLLQIGHLRRRRAGRRREARRVAAPRGGSSSAGAADMGEQGGERAGGDAFDARGLAKGGRAHGRQLLARLVGKAADARRSRGRRAGRGPRRGGRRRRRRPGGRDSRRRPRRSRSARARRPASRRSAARSAPGRRSRSSRIGQQLDQVAPLAVGVDLEAGARRLGAASASALGRSRARLVQRRGLGGEARGALGADAAQRDAPRRSAAGRRCRRAGAGGTRPGW